jgi:peptidoglycan-N-acetylglucosamine deacetylase
MIAISTFIPNFNFNLQLPAMRQYWVKTPSLIKSAYKSCLWHMPNQLPEVYLTFDDGPHPTITPFVLAELRKYNAKATFFCLGKNVQLYPQVYQQIIDEGHTIGNHTHNHFNGWHVDNAAYINNISEASKHIHSNLFRPPYGRIRPSQIKEIKLQFPEMKIVMWDVLTGDFDEKLSPEKCLKYVLKNTEPGSIIVFHDSEKAYKRLAYALPHFLQYCKQNKWQLKSL